MKKLLTLGVSTLPRMASTALRKTPKDTSPSDATRTMLPLDALRREMPGARLMMLILSPKISSRSSVCVVPSGSMASGVSPLTRRRMSSCLRTLSSIDAELHSLKDVKPCSGQLHGVSSSVETPLLITPPKTTGREVTAIEYIIL